ncbi:MAG: L,D-transpeptidase family protein, partial [Bacteroidota bacterium]
PDYSFTFYKNENEIQTMRVVVGENEHYTPVLEDTLHSVIFNPSWNVPNSIATEEIFPEMLEDTAYMGKNKYSVLLDSYVSEDTIDIKEFDWMEVSRDSFPFFIVQDPGPFNSLGEIQFMLQNQYSIYLHDTPADHLFNVEQRDFSHGCIRLEKPEQLAMILLNEQLPTDTLLSYISGEEKKVVNLEEKIPVHIMYQTAWVEDNNLHFREDIYEFDKLSMKYIRSNFPQLAFLMPKEGT